MDLVLWRHMREKGFCMTQIKQPAQCSAKEKQ